MSNSKDNCLLFFEKIFEYLQQNKIKSPIKLFTSSDNQSSLNLEHLILTLKKIKLETKIFSSVLDTIITKYKTTIRGEEINLESLLLDFKNYMEKRKKEIKIQSLKDKQKLIESPSPSPESSPRKTVKWKDEIVGKDTVLMFEESKKRELDMSKTISSSKDLNSTLQMSCNFKEFDLIGSNIISPIEKIILVEKKIQQEICDNNNYKLLRLYECFHMFTEKFGSKLEQEFLLKDPKRDGYLKKIEFDNTFKSINFMLTDESRLLIFNDLPSKDNNKYSYVAFLEKIYNFKKETLESQIKHFNHMYNEYLIQLRKHIRDPNKKIEIVEIIKANILSEELNVNEFFRILYTINFMISEKETEYLFNLISENGKTIKLNSFLNILYLNPPDQQSMRTSINKTKHLEKQNAWKDKLITFNYERAIDFQKHFIFIKSIFNYIKSTLISKGIENITDIFHTHDVNENGEVDDVVFVNVMSKFNIQSHKEFVNFMDYFLDKRKKKIDLLALINAYNAVLFDHKRYHNVDTFENEDKFETISAPKKMTKSNRKVFSKEDLENIREICNFLIEIVNTEKFMTISEFLKNEDKKKCGYFTIDVFLTILNELEIDTSGDSAESLNSFFDYVIEDKIRNIISIDKLLKIFKEMGCSEKEITNKYSSMEEKFSRDFSNHLLYSRIKFSSLFPGKETEDTLTKIDIIQALNISKFSYSERELNAFISMLDKNKTGKYSLSHLKKIIKLILPDYFEMPFQNLDELQIAKEIELKDKFKAILEKINRYIKENRLSIREFFDLVTKANPNQITQSEFIDLIQSHIDKEYPLKDLKELFNFLDKDKSNTISISELIPFLESSKLSNYEKMKKIVIPNNYLEEINKLFDHFDYNKVGKLSKQEFMIALKSVNKSITDKEIEKIITKNDFHFENFIDRKDFNIIMQDNIMKELISIENEKEQIVNLFKEEDNNHIGFLTIKQFKNLLKDKLECKLNEKTVDELINASESNFNGLIEIDEFISIIQILDQMKAIKSFITKGKTLITSFLNIFHGLPNIFIPSFTRNQQKKGKILPSSTIFPLTDKTGILYIDIQPDTDRTFQTKTTVRPINYMVLKPIPTIVNCRLNLLKATGIPLLDKCHLRDGIICGRQLKISFYNKFLHVFFGNSITLNCKWNEDYSDKWTFHTEKDNINNNLLIRFNEKEDKYITVLFEFVLIISKEKEIIEISCGWSEVNIFDLMKKSKFNLDIDGGTPQKKQKIVKKDLNIKSDDNVKTGWGKLQSMFNEEIKSQFTFESMSFKDLSEDEKTNMNFLPVTIILPKCSLYICSVYRKYVGKYILNNIMYLKKPIKYQDSIVKNFCYLMDCPDIHENMVILWKQLVVDTASKENKKDDLFWEGNLIVFVDNLYSVLYNEKFNFDFCDTSITSIGNPDLRISRKFMIYSCFNVKVEQKQIENENLLKFKPFCIKEMISEKVNISEKINEICELSRNTMFGNINIQSNNKVIRNIKNQKYNPNSMKFLS